MLRTSLLLAVALALVANVGVPPATAQAPARELLPVPQATPVQLPAAKLYRVDDGVFDVELGKVIDLTNRRVLLWIGRERDECCILTLNGERMSNWRIGSRFDLKRVHSTKEHVADRDQCYLDIIELILPKGGKGIATFRLHCI